LLTGGIVQHVLLFVRAPRTRHCPAQDSCIRGLASRQYQKILYPTPIKISGRVSLGALALKLVVGEGAEMLPKISGRIARRNQQRLGGRPDRDRRAFSSQCHRP
jgi:hypothetical protein